MKGGKSMNVAEVAGSSSVTNISNNNTRNNDVDKDFFMKLLVAQLKYQDPLSPVDNSEFMSQTAQFSTLEAIQALSDDFMENKLYSLLGKHCTANTLNNITGLSNEIEGIVESITLSGDDVLLKIGDHLVKPDSILKVQNG